MFRPGTELLIDGGSDERLNDGMGTTTNGTGSDVLMLKAVQMRGGEEIYLHIHGSSSLPCIVLTSL